MISKSISHIGVCPGLVGGADAGVYQPIVAVLQFGYVLVKDFLDVVREIDYLHLNTAMIDL